VTGADTPCSPQAPATPLLLARPLGSSAAGAPTAGFAAATAPRAAPGLGTDPKTKGAPPAPVCGTVETPAYREGRAARIACRLFGTNLTLGIKRTPEAAASSPSSAGAAAADEVESGARASDCGARVDACAGSSAALPPLAGVDPR
jgi:hypothetical protein